MVPEARGPRPARILAPSRSMHGEACSDLDTVNAVVTQAMLSWDLPARVRRLALPSLIYSSLDLEHMHIAIVDEIDGSGVGIAAWEEADQHDAPNGARAVLLHGLYVLPARQRQGTGTSLLERVEDWAVECDFDAIVLRAWRESELFFRARGFSSLNNEMAAQRYPVRMGRFLR